MKKISLILCLGLSWGIHAQSKKSGIHVDYMNPSANPKTDFYEFACGSWMKNNSIPTTEASFGSFNEIKDRNEANLKKILESASADKAAKPGSNKKKIGDFYRIILDTNKLEKDGVKPIMPLMKKVESVKSAEDLVVLMAEFQRKGIDAGFSYYIYADMKNSNVNISYFSQSGFNLPDRDYYFEKKYESVKLEYVKHIENVFKLMGKTAEEAIKASSVVMKVETSMAEFAMNRVQLRNVEASYNLFTKEEFLTKFPNFNWNLYFKTQGFAAVPETFIVGQPKFFEQFNTLLQTLTLEEWKTYLSFHLMDETSSYLSKAFVQENFNFYSTVLSGVKVMKPRWKTALRATDNVLGEALGQLFVEKHFNDAAKRKVNEMVDNLIASYKERIDSREWMSPETKKQAHLKLDKIYRKLGFPDKWKDYTKLDIKYDSYAENMFRSHEFEYREMVEKLPKPVDKSEWGMTPPTVNAYYNPSSNEIAFPAGIMQPPFFDVEADDAANYGCMGAIIGHELTHGFDDEGSQFDADGNLKNWWTEEDKHKFEEKTNVLVNQFGDLVAIDSIHVNGELTLGENIADLGGITMSYYAYKKSLKGKPSPVLDGYSGEQRFFIAWAQGWKSMMRPEALKHLVATNPHAPGKFRAFIPLTNLKEFYEAFGIKEGDPMYRQENKRANIW